MYRGKVKLGEDGTGTIEMPSYFVSLTKENEATVTLTPVGNHFLPAMTGQITFLLLLFMVKLSGKFLI
jgi:hypothetical protein